MTWSRPALVDMERIHAYYSGLSLRFADKLVASYFDRTVLLSKFPQLGHRSPDFKDETIRELSDARSRIVYKILNAESDVAIVRVFLTKQDVKPDTPLD